MYAGLGYPVFPCSALTGAGLPAIENLIKGKRSLFVGPSGTGKSSLVNRLIPEAAQRTGRISKKFNRGTHTTCFAVLLKGKADTECIDTPGIREVHVYDVEAAALKGYFPEFHALEASCAFQPCLHSEEDDCAVKKAAETGAVDPERYDSYLRILSALQEGPGDRNG
ncbi:MAG: ribosome small subunit-dependent GTPase A [Spirochaetales bacterium]|nr:MAG: ribosome small subunit-dependent GTPase A [Spirochaetales bacterium]